MPQLQYLNALNEMTIYAWDPPGFGDSRPPNREWGMDFLEKDAKLAHEFMTQMIGDKPFNVCGWCAGGNTG